MIARFLDEVDSGRVLSGIRWSGDPGKTCNVALEGIDVAAHLFHLLPCHNHNLGIIFSLIPERYAGFPVFLPITCPIKTNAMPTYRYNAAFTFRLNAPHRP